MGQKSCTRRLDFIQKKLRKGKAWQEENGEMK